MKKPKVAMWIKWYVPHPRWLWRRAVKRVERWHKAMGR